MKVINILVSGVAVLVLLSGCGKDDDNAGGGTPAPTPAATPAPTPTPQPPDSFITAVRGIAANAPDNTEPADINSVQGTAPDNTEAEAI